MVARITGCAERKDAQRIAESFFPDLTVRAIPWFDATNQQLWQSRQEFLITPRMCRRANAEPPPEPPNLIPIPVEQAVERLRLAFPKAKTAGGGQ